MGDADDHRLVSDHPLAVEERANTHGPEEDGARKCGPGCRTWSDGIEERLGSVPEPVTTPAVKARAARSRSDHRNDGVRDRATAGAESKLTPGAWCKRTQLDIGAGLSMLRISRDFLHKIERPDAGHIGQVSVY